MYRWGEYRKRQTAILEQAEQEVFNRDAVKESESIGLPATLVIYTDSGEKLVKGYSTMKGAKIGAYSRMRYYAYMGWSLYSRFVVVFGGAVDWGTCDFRGTRWDILSMNQSREG